MSTLAQKLLLLYPSASVGGSADTTAPVLSNATDTVTGSTTAELAVTTNSGEGILYAVSSALEPTAAQIKAGNDSTGAAADIATSQAVDTPGAQSIPVTGLTADTAYDPIWFMQEDVAENQSNVVGGDGFTTWVTNTDTLLAEFEDEPTYPHQVAYNAFYKSLLLGAVSGNNILAKLDRAWAPWAETEQQYSVDLVHPADSDPITFVNSPPFTPGHGPVYNGVDQWADVNFDPTTDAVNFLQDSHSVGWRSETNAQIAAAALGWFDGTDGIQLIPRSPNDQLAFRSAQALQTQTALSSVTDSRVVAAFNRSASNATQAYRSGSAVSLTINANQTSVAFNAHSLHIAHPTDVLFGAYDGGGWLWLGGSLTANEHMDIRNAFVALRTALKA